MIFLLDKLMRVVGVLSNENPKAVGFFDDSHKELLEDAYETYTFSTPADNPLIEGGEYAYFAVRDLDRLLHVFKIVNQEDSWKDGKRAKTFLGESIAVEVARTIVRPTAAATYTAAQALEAALQGSTWQVGQVDWAGTASVEFNDYMTALAAVRLVRDTFRQEANGFYADLRFRYEFDGTRITGKFVDLLARRGTYTGKRFTYDKDLRGVSKTYDVSDVVTALVVVGKDGATVKNTVWSKASGDPADKPLAQDWIGDNDALQEWSTDGQHIFGIYRNDQETDPGVLLSKAWDYLQTVKSGLITYETEVALLAEVATLEHEKVRLGDTVLVKDATFAPPIQVSARVVSLERSYSNPAKDRVTLGNYLPVMTSTLDEIQKLQAAIRGVSGGGETIYKAATPPDSPTADMLWLDTSVTPNLFKRWSGSDWIKAAPTTASEVGAETPAGAQSKADAARDSAESAVASGEVPLPTSALSGAVDVATNAIQADSNFKWDSAGLVAVDPADSQKQVRLTSGGLGVSTDGGQTFGTAITGEGIVASQITSGTLSTSKVTVASDDGGVVIDGSGVTVDQGQFKLKDSATQVASAVRENNNMLNDPSFEMIPTTGSADSNNTFAVDTTHPHYGNSFWWLWAGSDPRVLGTYNTDSPQLARFDYQAAVVSLNSRPYQLTELDAAVGLAGPYSASVYVAAYGGTTADCTAKLLVYARDAGGAVIQTVGSATVSLKAAEKFRWRRVAVTVSNLPANTSLLEVNLWFQADPTAGQAYIADGVQLVPLPSPAVYAPESGLWRSLRGLNGYWFKSPLMKGEAVGDSLTLGKQSALSVNLTADVTLPAGTFVKIAKWSTTNWAPCGSMYGEWDGTGQSFTVKGSGGTYILTVALRMTGLSGSNSIVITVDRNGTEYARICHLDAGAGPYGIAHATGTIVLFLKPGDKIEVSAYATNGATVGSAAAWSYLKMWKMG